MWNIALKIFGSKPTAKAFFPLMLPMNIYFSAQCAATLSNREIVGLKMYF